MQPYDDLFAKHGATARSTNGCSPANPHYFWCAERVAPNSSVLDVGSGLGWLKPHLPEGVTYKGIDACQGLAESTGDEHCDILSYTGDKVDYVCCFGVLVKNDPREQPVNLQAVADKLKSLANVAVLFAVCLDGFSLQEVETAFGGLDEVSPITLGEHFCRVNV